MLNEAVAPTAIRSVSVPCRRFNATAILIACGCGNPEHPPSTLAALLESIVETKITLPIFLARFASALRAYSAADIRFEVRPPSKGRMTDLTVHLPGFSFRVHQVDNVPMLTIGVSYHGRDSAGPAASGLLAILELLGMSMWDQTGFKRGDSDAPAVTLKGTSKRDHEGYPVFEWTSPKLTAWLTFYPDLLSEPENPFAIRRGPSYNRTRNGAIIERSTTQRKRTPGKKTKRLGSSSKTRQARTK